jgi:hypothetical protein
MGIMVVFTHQPVTAEQAARLKRIPSACHCRAIVSAVRAARLTPVHARESETLFRSTKAGKPTRQRPMRTRRTWTPEGPLVKGVEDHGEC